MSHSIKSRILEDVFASAVSHPLKSARRSCSQGSPVSGSTIPAAISSTISPKLRRRKSASVFFYRAPYSPKDVRRLMELVTQQVGRHVASVALALDPPKILDRTLRTSRAIVPRMTYHWLAHRYTEVADANRPVVVNKDVRRLQVQMDDVRVVDRLDSQRNLVQYRPDVHFRYVALVVLDVVVQADKRIRQSTHVVIIRFMRTLTCRSRRDPSADRECLPAPTRL